MILDSYYTTDSAAEFLGITKTTVRNLTVQKKLTPIKVGNSNLYHIDDLLSCKGLWYADGLSPRDIGERYDVSKSMVHYHLNRLKIDPVGVDGRRKGQPSVYSPNTIEKVSKIVGWQIKDPP
jgi:excisionase family DNA binding protein